MLTFQIKVKILMMQLIENFDFFYLYYLFKNSNLQILFNCMFKLNYFVCLKCLNFRNYFEVANLNFYFKSRFLLFN